MLPHRSSPNALAALGVVPWTACVGTWTVTSIGPGIVEMLGHPRTAWRERGFWLESVHPDDRGDVRLFLERAAGGTEGGAQVREYRVHDRAGRWHWLRTTLEPPAAGARRLSGFHLEISKTRAGHDSASEDAAERMHRDLWEAIPSRAAVIQRDGTIVRINHAWAMSSHRLGGPPTAFVGWNYLDVCKDAAHAGDDLGRQALLGIQSVLAGAQRDFQLDYPHAAPSCVQPAWFRMQVVARAPVGAIVLHEDITDRVRDEWEMHRCRCELADRLRRAELQEMASLLAHELNQPLSVIMASASAARQMLRDRPHSDVLTDIIGDVLQAVGRAGHVVRRTRGLVQREAKEHGWFSLTDLIADVGRLLAPDASARQVSLSFDVNKRSLGMLGDREQMQEALLNLVLNALEAVSNQPRERRKVRVTAHGTEDVGVDIRVKDTGPGISPLIAHRLFEPFATTKQNGVGLGLCVARAIVQAHGGEVLAESPTEGGAAFRVVIPGVR